MNNDPSDSRSRELSWRQNLSDAEAAELRAWRAAHPEAEPDWLAEEQLNQALRGLADVPVASNFTARVVQAIERDARPAPTWRLDWLPRGWIPKAAVAVVLVAVGVLSLREHQFAQRRKLAVSLASLASVRPPPNQEVLLDYEAIRLMEQAAPADREILSLFQ